MASLKHLLDSNKTVRAVGFDDAPHRRGQSEPVGLAGVVCRNTRFDGMVWDHIEPDGWDSGDVVAEMLERGKFLEQLDLVLLDGIAFGGFNVVDLPALAERLGLPCASVMRRRPDFEAIEAALSNLEGAERRLERMKEAGPIHPAGEVFCQVQGGSPETVVRAIERLTYRGHIPEPVRIAHLVGSAVATGESGRRA
jgi:hypothetical protein